MLYSSLKKLTVLILLGGAALNLNAAEYRLDMSVNQRIYYDGNIVLGSVIEEEVSGYQLEPSARLQARSSRWEWGLNSLLRFTRLSNQLYDSDDQNLGFNLARAGERNRVDLNADVTRNSTRSSAPELDFVVAASRLENRSVRASWTRILNEKNSLVLGGNWGDAEYASARFSGYRTFGVDLAWLRQITEQLTLQVSSYKSHFDTGDAPQGPGQRSTTESDSIGLQLGLTRQVSESFSASVTIGGRRVDTTENILVFGFFPAALEDQSNGFTAAGNLDYISERYSINASMSRTLVPNGFFGGLFETDRLTLLYSRQMRPQMFFDLYFNFVQDESLESNSFNREWFEISPKLRWQFAERWSLESSLRHRVVTRNQFGGKTDAEGSAIFFNLRYRHPQKRW